MKLRYCLSATVAMVCVGLMPVGSTRAGMTTYGSAGIATAAIIERSYIEISPSVGPSAGSRSATESDSGGVGSPALLPGLLLFGATTFAYLWYWRSKLLTGQKSGAGILA